MAARKKGGQRLTEISKKSKKSRTKPKLVDGKDGYRKGDPVKTFKPPAKPKRDPVKTLTIDTRKDNVEKKRARRRQMLKIEQEGARKEGKHWDKYLSQDKFNLVKAAKRTVKEGMRRSIPPILSKSSYAEGIGKAVKQAKKQIADRKKKK